MAKNKSLIATDTSVIPESFSQEVAPIAEGPLYSITPYVSFVSLKSAAFPKLAPYYPDLREGEPVLFKGADSHVRLDPFRYYLIQYRVHYTEADSEGSVVRSTMDAGVAKGDKSLKENVETVLIVCTKEGLVPARCTFRTTKTKAVWSAINHLAVAKDGDKWGKLSPEHAATLGAPDPRFRFTATVHLSYGRLSKSTGYKFTEASATVKPTALADWQALTAALNDKAFRALCDDVVTQWKERIAMIESHCA